MRRLVAGLLSLSLAACAGDSGGGRAGTTSGDPGDPGGTGLAPSGAQDFGRFKAILERGEIPAPGTLDQIGFFAEHKIGTPPTQCEGEVCARGVLGAMGNFITGSNCTLIHLGLGTPIDPMARPRPALDAALVIEQGAKMLRAATAYGEIRSGVAAMLDGMHDGDTLSVIAVANGSTRLVERAARGDRAAIDARLAGLAPADGSNLYDGLRAAMSALGPARVGRHRRVILVGDGRPTTGLRDRDRLVRLARSFAEEGGGLTILALGEDSDARLLGAMADLGAGALYHVGASTELPSVMAREVGYSLTPVAEKVRIRVAPGMSWRLREVFGVKGWSLDEGGGTIDIPALFVAWRKGVATPEEGRRGGGGGILIELLPRRDARADDVPSTVADLEVGWAVPGSGAWRTRAVQVVSREAPGQTSPAGSFGDGAVEKGFVVLNLYVGLRMASERAAAGDLRGAHDVLASLGRNAGRWLMKHPDAEIADDLRWVERFRALLEARGALTQPPRAGWFSEPWPRD